jgi:alginate production protein
MIRIHRPAALAVALAASAACADQPLVSLRTVLGTDAELERNFDLDDGDRDRASALEGTLRFEATILPGRSVSGFIELEAQGEVELEQEEPRETSRFLRVNQAFVRFRDVVEDTDLRLGRWLFRDEREWLFDENIDGARLTLEPDDWTVELLAGRVNAFQRDLLDRDSRGDEVWELAALAEREVSPELHLGGYAILRLEDEVDRDMPLHIGLRARGAPFDEGRLAGLSFWADAGVVRGREDGRDLRGWGFDVGVLHSFDDLPGRPRLQLGYAFGSGEDRSTGTDRAFRQTGLQSNEDERGSLAKYKYYGEALDPELSNLGVLTAGVGFALGDVASMDLIYHHYDKHRAGGDLRDIALSADADQPFRDVGHGLDLVLGLRPADTIEIEAAVGVFRPGRAFRERDDALFARIELDVEF